MSRKCAVCREPSNAFLCENPACREAHNARCREWQRANAQKSGQWANAKYRKRKSGATCMGCGRPTRGGSAEPKCRACHHPVRSRRDKALEKLVKAAAGTRGMRTWTCGKCWRCGDEFASSRGSRYCSPSCQRRDKRATRRALEAGVKVTPGRRHAVFVRDDWTCRICGDPVNRDARVPERDAPTIDHIVPLARGGAHALENWQTAHFWCNSWKGDLEDFDFTEEAG